jgi:hypothetical protein
MSSAAEAFSESHPRSMLGALMRIRLLDGQGRTLSNILCRDGVTWRHTSPIPARGTMVNTSPCGLGSTLRLTSTSCPFPSICW